MISVEKRIFETEDEFIEFVYSQERGTFEKKQRLIEHERAHYDKAIELGYQPKYGFFKGEIKLPFLIYTLNIAFVSVKLKIRDISKVVLAPKNPSLADKILAIGSSYLNI